MKIIKLVVVALSLLLSDNMNAQDWANLQHYKQENLSLNSSLNSEKRVVFMGNSITEGWKIANPAFFQKSYLCRGISGQTTPQMLVRFRQDVIELKPWAVVILAGINDIAENTGPSTLGMIQNNLASMCELASANGIQVYICSVLPTNILPWRLDIKPADKVIELNSWIRGYAQQKGYVFVDFYSAMVNSEKGLKSELTTDGVHCTPLGYSIMESVLIPLLTKND